MSTIGAESPIRHVTITVAWEDGTERTIRCERPLHANLSVTIPDTGRAVSGDLDAIWPALSAAPVSVSADFHADPRYPVEVKAAKVVDECAP